MILQRAYSSLAGVVSFNILAGIRCGADAPADCAAGFALAITECEKSGLANPQIVRSRVWARDAALRRVASDTRLEALAGARRAASASFIAPERMGDDCDVIVDLVAMNLPQPKIVREYEPRIAPPMFLAADDFVFVSGNTDTSATYQTQIDRICANIAKSLAVARTDWSQIVKADAYVLRSLDLPRVYRDLAARFPCAISVTSVEGYSAPEKLVEIEVTARRTGE